MDPWTSIDLYCERTDASFWSEPLNAISNLAFILAAVLIARRARDAQGRLPRDAAVLAGLAALVGAGSFLFHTFATVWGRWLDLGSIAAFIYAFLAVYLRRIAGLGWRGVVGGLALYAVFERAVLAAVPLDALGGSLLYLPALAALAGLAAFAWRRGHEAGRGLAWAAGAFAAAVAIRTADLPLCASWPSGTHFLWHVAMAWVLYRAAMAMLSPRGSPSG